MDGGFVRSWMERMNTKAAEQDKGLGNDGVSSVGNSGEEEGLDVGDSAEVQAVREDLWGEFQRLAALFYPNPVCGTD